MRHDDGICDCCGMLFGGMTEAEVERTAAYADSLAQEWDGKPVLTLLEASEWRIAREALAQGIGFMECDPGSRYAVAGIEGLLEHEEFEAMLGLTRMIEVGLK